MKTRLLYIVLIASMCWIAPAYGVVIHDFSRYEVILERRPFGEVSSDAELAAEALPVAPSGPSFVDSLQMCAITDGGGALRVGFLDMKTNPPKTYFLFVGESEDGIQVVSADYDGESALLRKEGEERLLRMAGPSSPAIPSSAAPASIGSVAHRPSGRRTVIPKSTLTRRQYEEERELGIRGAPVPPRLALRGMAHTADTPLEVRDLAMRKYNMDLIRAGGAHGVPLPIELTPEEDAQLVAEGVLKPKPK